MSFSYNRYRNTGQQYVSAGKTAQKCNCVLKDNRPQSVQMMASGKIPASGTQGIVQRVNKKNEKLRDRKWKLPNKRLARKYSRAIRFASGSASWKNNSRRNVLVARFLSGNGKKRYNMVLRSAGMGGVHPRGIDGRSAAHTEPQMAALLVNPLFRKRLSKKLGAKWKVHSVFSSNQPCSSPGGGSSEGCGGMKSAAMGSPEETQTISTGAYKGGSGVNLGQTVRGLDDIGGGQDDDYSSGSEDEYFEEDDVRGSDLTKDRIW